jgi:NitT/TauT family transport system ATP-binding protein
MTGRIQVRGLAKSYGTGRFARRVVEDCTFTVEPGELVVMIGPSGVGKSTIVRLLAGYEKPTRGEILLDGKPVRRPGSDRMVVFQETALFPWMTTERNILYGPDARGETDEVPRRRAASLLERIGLTAFRDKYPAQLSGGMQRRAELARALVNDPAVMILDEPFRGLDAMTKKLMIEYHASLHEAVPRTSLFVTTDIDEAIVLADRLLIMSNIPTRVRAVIPVDLPRPRRLADIVDDDRANEIKIRALSLLHEEALRSFAAGSRAAADFVAAYRRRHEAAGSTRSAR